MKNSLRNSLSVIRGRHRLQKRHCRYSLKVELGGILTFGKKVSFSNWGTTNQDVLWKAAEDFSSAGDVENVGKCHEMLLKNNSFEKCSKTMGKLAEQRMRALVSKGLYKEALIIFNTQFDGVTADVTETTILLIIDILRITKATASDWVDFLKLVFDIIPLTNKLSDAVMSSMWDSFPVSVWLFYVIRILYGFTFSMETCQSLLMSLFRNPGVEQLLFKVMFNPMTQKNSFTARDVVENIEKLLSENQFGYTNLSTEMHGGDNERSCDIFEIAELPLISSKTPQNELPLIKYLSEVITLISSQTDQFDKTQMSLCLNCRASSLGGLVNRVLCEAHSYETLAGVSHIGLYEKCVEQLRDWRMNEDVVEMWDYFIYFSNLHKSNYPKSEFPLKISTDLCVTSLLCAHKARNVAAATRMTNSIYYSDISVDKQLLNAMLLATSSTDQCLQIFKSSSKSSKTPTTDTIYALLWHAYEYRPKGVEQRHSLPLRKDSNFVNKIVTDPVDVLSVDQLKKCFTSEVVNNYEEISDEKGSEFYHTPNEGLETVKKSDCDGDPFVFVMSVLELHSHISLDLKCFSIMITNYLYRFRMSEAVQSTVDMIIKAHLRPSFEDIGMWREACSISGLRYSDFTNYVNSNIPKQFSNRQL